MEFAEQTDSNYECRAVCFTVMSPLNGAFPVLAVEFYKYSAPTALKWTKIIELALCAETDWNSVLCKQSPWKKAQATLVDLLR